MNIQWIGSPNFDTNRVKIDRIVIHWMVGTLAITDGVFQKSGGTSAHYGVEDDRVHQYVNLSNVAYHAGNYPMNQRSIGIEHSADPNRPASDKTYETSASLIADICRMYNIPLDRQHIIGHRDVIPTQCPGTIDIDRLIKRALEINKPSEPMNPLPVELQHYSIKWKDYAIKYGIDQNGPQLKDYRDIDQILSDKLKEASVQKDAQIADLQKKLAAATGNPADVEDAKKWRSFKELIK